MFAGPGIWHVSDVLLSSITASACPRGVLKMLKMPMATSSFRSTSKY